MAFFHIPTREYIDAARGPIVGSVQEGPSAPQVGVDVRGCGCGRFLCVLAYTHTHATSTPLVRHAPAGHDANP